ncbi:MAG: 2-C-methyl-D-erythritol 2 4-cyclodiphosphate synthase [Pseudomonadota bacterium]|jgi:2-C-methyl-D-erythritol 2,4-cyclodiphosphate synthase
MKTHLRIGQGYDVHAFETGQQITLGGIVIPCQMGLKAHSDGDVVIHALVDALLGAAALGDIGQHFPDTDIRWKQKSSGFFLQAAVQMLYEKKWAINNVDISIIAEAPKLQDYKDAMRSKLAQTMGVDITQVNVKATTNEGLGFIGRKEGIAVTAIALIQAL